MPTLNEPVRLILLAESDDWSALLRQRLDGDAQSITLVSASCWEAARDWLGSAADAVLLCTPACRPEPGACNLPVVLLLDEEPEVEPLGVIDWLVRERLTDDVLRRCLRYAREFGSLKQSLRRLAERDQFTGIANRQRFHKVLSARLSERGAEDVALAYLDLDDFRHINDVLGYRGGDQLILQVVSRLQGLLGEHDCLARLGNDEFALLIDRHDAPQRPEQLARRIVEALGELYCLGDESLLIGCSLGLALAQAHDSAEQLLKHAHMAMLQAKQQDGCAFALYDEFRHRQEPGHLSLEAELRRALRRDELILQYQPRLELETGRLMGVEALVRWQHPTRGLLGPGEFIGLAEDSGLIVPLGYWVIARALREMQALRADGQPALQLAINLSFRQFLDGQFLSTVTRLIEEQGFDARCLEFELTETAVMQRSEAVRGTMLALAERGVRFSLDDFGTGFSSFVHLKELPIRLLKVDRGFVAGMDGRAEHRQLVKAMINLAHNLGLHVVAEGVETPAELELLSQFGCDQVQGYLISAPVTAAQLATLLSRHAPMCNTRFE